MTLSPAQDDGDPVIPAPGTRMTGVALGIDVGGTGVKAALVDLATAELLTDRIREKTPQPSVPEAVADTIASVVSKVFAEHPMEGPVPVGCGLPGVVKYGRLTTAANLDSGWVGWPAAEKIGEKIGHPVMIINDADAAGLAETAYGAAEGVGGTVLLLTLGTGIGSALIWQGELVPNTELGHLEIHSKDAETRLSGASRERRRLGWKRWAREFDYYLSRLELYLQPDLIVLGGGVSKEMPRFEKYLEANAPIVTARFLNTSGIIGAAYAAAADQRVQRMRGLIRDQWRRIEKGDPGTFGHLPEHPPTFVPTRETTQSGPVAPPPEVSAEPTTPTGSEQPAPTPEDYARSVGWGALGGSGVFEAPTNSPDHPHGPPPTEIDPVPPAPEEASH